jgi:RNA-directed DNA polymerase
MRQTAASRFNRVVKAIADWCRRNRHRPIPEQHATLSRKLRGHYGYYGITGNSRALATLRHVVTRIWRTWLSRRSWAGYFSWLRFERLRASFALPPPIVVHSVYRRGATL